MTGFLDNLNLRPQEKRLVVIVALVVFIVLNWLFVRPHFGDYRKLTNNLENARVSVRRYVDKINQDNATNGFKVRLMELEQEEGSAVIETDIQLQRTIYAQANEAKVVINNYMPITARSTGQTNEFFEEQSGRIAIEADEKSLVEFLFKLGEESSMIRVKDLDLKPGDANRYKLRGTITLGANYQKKPAAPPASAKTPAKASAPDSTKKAK